jgi:two-component system sensor histidine kinase AtoS
MIQILQNPFFVKLGLILFMFMAGLAVVILALRSLRKMLVSSSEDDKPRVSLDSAFTLSAYEGVIRKMKEQEKELERLRRSERNQANESASMSEAVLSNLSSGVVLFNNANLVRQANPSAKTLLGYASAFGLHSRDIFRGVSKVRMPASPTSARGEESDGAGQLLNAIDSAIRQGTQVRRIEADYRTPSGESRVLGITISPVRGAQGEALGAAALISDLTEITQLSQQMRLRESMAALGEMSAGIAHEFKNSLATISGYAQMLQKENDATTSNQFATKIAAETASLARIVNDFLNFARPQGLAREPLDVRKMLEDCAEEAQVELDTEKCPAEIMVLGDPTALRQAFSNLLRNSAEAVRQGERPKASLTASVNAAGTILALTDNGTGIAPEQLSRIFIPFFTTKPEGTGLGLALVHRIITEHAGTINVTSNGSGTTFTLAFPPSISAGNRANIAAQSE